MTKYLTVCLGQDTLIFRLARIFQNQRLVDSNIKEAMKPAIVLLLGATIALNLVTCTLSKGQFQPGVYYSQSRDSETTVVLRLDSTFQLAMRVWDAQPSCNGTYSMQDSMTIILRCDSENEVEKLISSSYLNTRVIQLQVVDNNTLKWDQTILNLRN